MVGARSKGNAFRVSYRREGVRQVHDGRTGAGTARTDSSVTSIVIRIQKSILPGPLERNGITLFAGNVDSHFKCNTWWIKIPAGPSPSFP